MQTILGAGGPIGIDLAKALKNNGHSNIRLVSRNTKKVNDSDELFPADLTNRQQVLDAIKDSEIVYVTKGFPYQLKVWQALWPPFIKNVIDGCEQHKAKLVFFDNVYIYDKDEIPHQTEESKINPPSEKGKVRANVSKQITDAYKSGRIGALIARSADFYGPLGTDRSVLMSLVYNAIKSGRGPNWLKAMDMPHSFTYTPDAAKAVAILGNKPEAYNQVWHLPTHRGLTGEEWISLVSETMGKKKKGSVMPKFMMTVLGWFIPEMREFPEMLYQYDQEYFFDSSKFEQAFPDFKITTPEEGVKQTIKILQA